MITTDVDSAFEKVRNAFPISGYIDPHGEGERAIAVELLRARSAGGRLLDIGAGALVKTALFSNLGFECYACDDYQDPWHRRDGHFEKVMDFARTSGITTHVHREGDYTIPFQEESFDVVTICDVIEHLHESPRELLNVGGRLLRAGGILLITMPNVVNLKKRIKVVIGRSNYPDVAAFFCSASQWRGHVREYTLAETAYIVTTAGFEVVRAHTFDRASVMKIPWRVARAVYYVLAALVPTFRDSLVVVGRKPAGWTPVNYSEDADRAAQGDSVPAGVR